MSIVLAAALAASTATLPSCSWDRPGVNPFMGDVVAAVDRYADIPAPTRAALKARMAKRQYDDVANITRDGIAGQQRYTDLRDMHFGAGRVCQTVTRERWTPSTQERGLVYCEDGHCIIVPTVCRNVSRVTREPQARAAQDGNGGSGSAAESPQMLASQPFPAPPIDQSELKFEAPTAGVAPSLADGLRDPLQALAPTAPGLTGDSGGSGSAGSTGGYVLPSIVNSGSGDATGSGGTSSSPGSFGDRSGIGVFPGTGGIGGFPGSGPIVAGGGSGGSGGSTGGTGGSGGTDGTGGTGGSGGTDGTGGTGGSGSTGGTGGTGGSGNTGGTGGTGGSGGTGGTGGTGGSGGTDGTGGTGGSGGGNGGTDPGGSGGGGGVVVPPPPPPPISPIPEPSTWALMLGGLALVGMAARRRAQQGRRPG